MLPDFLKSFQSKTKDYFDKKLIKDIEFSGGTYQVQMIDLKTHKDVWAFLQLDKRGKIKDSFCSCEEGEDIHHCVHQAVAFLRIYNEQLSPLHQRFERSLWNCLCQLYSERMGYHPNVLKQVGKGSFACYSIGGKVVFSVKGKTTEANLKLEDMIRHRRHETEETSLKFSNLSQEEIMQWREGRPTARLRYELSFWNDLAKWLMLLQDDGVKYEISFGFSSRKIPNLIEIHFPSVDLAFYISEANLPLIVPALSTIKSPLVVHHSFEEQIEKIIYDKKEGILKIIHKTSVSNAEKTKKQIVQDKGISIDGWAYVQNDGFYPTDRHFILEASELSGKQIEEALNEYHRIMKSLVEGVSIHEDPVHASYAISFDEKWNLHLNCYVFNTGDLNTGYSRRFGQWVYLDDDGFYRLEDIQFKQEEIVIPAKEVAQFVSQNRTFLNAQEGFRTHLANIEANLTYQLSDDHHLSFNSDLEIVDESAESKDFGEWIYIAGRGFFAKAARKTSLPVHSGITISGDQIPVFIHMNRDELQFVRNFFSETCPVVNSKLDIELTPKNQVKVTPHYELLPEYQDKPIRYFDEYVYVDGEGFHELPGSLRLPEAFRHPVTIENKDLDLFLEYELDALKPFAKKVDPRLLQPKATQLITELITKKEVQGKQWYVLKFKYETEKGKVLLENIWEAISRKERYVFSDAGLIDLEDRRFDWLKHLNKNQINRKNHSVMLSTLELLRLHAFERILIKSDKRKDLAESKDLFGELTEFRISEEPDLTGLKSHLRPIRKLEFNGCGFFIGTIFRTFVR